MPNIFISFRKVDNRWMRDRVYQALADAFGPEEIFKSGESIPAGGDFAAILRREAAECRVMLVLIGTGWADARDAGGARLLERADDWVRVEVATALAAGNRVVPVLLGDSAMLPAPAALPDDITGLAHLQFLRLPETHLEGGLDRIVTAVSHLLPELPRGPRGETAAAPAPVAAPAQPPAAAPVTQNTGGGNAVSVQGGVKNTRIAGGDIRETKVHTGGVFTAAATFLTSKAGIAVTTVVVAGAAVTAVATVGGGSPRADPPAASGRAVTTAAVALGDADSGYYTVPKAWYACTNAFATNDSMDIDTTGKACSSQPDVGTLLHIEVVGYPDMSQCTTHGWSDQYKADVPVPPTVAAHLASLASNAQVSAGHVWEEADSGDRWGVNLCVSLPQFTPADPSQPCFEILQLLGSAPSGAPESKEPALWQAAQTVRLGANHSCH